MVIRAHLRGFIHWPTSRRLLLLGFTGALTTTLAVVANELIFGASRGSALDLGLIDHYMSTWIVVQIAVTATAIPAGRAGREGKWAAYLFAAVQSPFIVGLLHLFGTMGTPLVAIYPAIVILWTLVLDEWIGLFGFCNLVVWMGIVGTLEIAQLLPYAPAILTRQIDVQNDPRWFTAVSMHILILLGFVTSLCVLFQRTQRAQQRRLLAAHEALEQANRLIRRYVPAQLGDQIASGHYVESAKPERLKLTVVYAAVEQFMAAAEELEAEDLASILAQYIADMVAIADRHGGTVNQIVDDGVMVFFGAPRATSDRDHALRAARMALEMQDCIENLRDMWSRYGLNRPFQISIGINTGYASVGDFGSAGRKLYAGIGVQTRLAKHLQSQCEPGGVLMSHSSWALVHDEIRCVKHGELPVAGLGAPLQVYAIQSLLRQQPTLYQARHTPESGSPALANSSTTIWQFGDTVFNEGSLELSVAGTLINLERKPLEVLRYLLWHAGDVVTKEELLDAVWPGRVLNDTAVTKCVCRLREALRDDNQCIIKTAHGYGYRFAAEIASAPIRR
ncbi:winged helix-turn-helix domain-containing protein [Solimonas terrae]|uniref:Adenylate/guanylate cyclase domain-containing protein n=1 Tax=Solimonas terrae TaxID=1396819 RepID=A0A6M2BRB7_9GAMM|nr:adenylate/guanylate cyclase domain-containing protein [Solimonas terrae]NGY04557.1 hypothetical protein [Solimonas terrae]